MIFSHCLDSWIENHKTSPFRWWSKVILYGHWAELHCMLFLEVCRLESVKEKILPIAPLIEDFSLLWKVISSQSSEHAHLSACRWLVGRTVDFVLCLFTYFRLLSIVLAHFEVSTSLQSLWKFKSFPNIFGDILFILTCRRESEIFSPKTHFLVPTHNMDYTRAQYHPSLSLCSMFSFNILCWWIVL